jgi:membrane-bound serine protease (ClpP class)
VPALRVDIWRLLPVIVAFAAFVIVLVRLVVQAQRRKPVTGREGLLGLAGRAETDLAPEGWVLVAGERWRGVGEDGPIGGGEPVVVVAMQGLTLRVRKGA